MVESQVRPNDVTDRRIIRAMLDLPREWFVPAPEQTLAYRDEPIPLGGGRALPQPMVTAKLIHAASVEPTHTVLEVGAATGYGSALLAGLAQHVVALEVDPALAATAKANLAALGTVEVVTGPLADGWAQGGPYDVVIVHGGVSDVPAGLLAQVAERGRLVAVTGDRWLGDLTVFERAGSQWSRRRVQAMAAPMLPGFAKQPVFAL
jgi:protein-L-isoaspartate(D-aspartate) O-methyltransferase